MANKLRVRDRDAPISKEGLIFRVYGYTHPPNTCICDLEYAPSNLYCGVQKGLRQKHSGEIYYKFYGDSGLKFVKDRFPQYQIFAPHLGHKLVGLKSDQISEIRRPSEKLKQILNASNNADPLLKDLTEIIQLITERANIKPTDLGVFGSILHGFHNWKFSDIDMVIYGKSRLKELLNTLKVIQNEAESPIRNEFEVLSPIKSSSAHWRFKNYSKREYIWHEKRKLIWSVFRSSKMKRWVKLEFEPVREWEEIPEYIPHLTIKKIGWIKAVGEVLNDENSPFMPAVYEVKPIKILKGCEIEFTRVISYVEEFRMQVKSGEKFLVEGNAEQVTLPNGDVYYQVTLSYCPRYYDQVLKTYAAQMR
ncbi:MAG: nucleotidyltransferase domain-containing protein [Candidatus Odinarchaeia archaeon]